VRDGDGDGAFLVVEALIALMDIAKMVIIL
jgi:hypothetical protein